MSWKKCINNPCVVCLVKFVRWIPVFFIVSVIGWSYYAYVYELCIRSVPSVIEKVFYLTFYHVFLLLFLWSYWMASMADLAVPMRSFKVPPDIVFQLKSSQPSVQRRILEEFCRTAKLPLQTRTFDGGIRFCEKCEVVKPDRAHHCSVCGCCVLKMDHHCPWVNTCVSYSNYKFFLLFLGYALLYCIYVAITDLRYFIRFWTNELPDDHKPAGKFHIMFLFFVALMFSVSVSVLFFYHLWLTSKNKSTLESFRAPVFLSGPDKDGFNLGIKANFQEVFGDDRRRWFLPVFSSLGDGCLFPNRHSSNTTTAAATNGWPNYGSDGLPSSQDILSSSHGSSHPSGHSPIPLSASAVDAAQTESGQVNQSFGDGVTFPVKTYELEEDGLLNHTNRWLDDSEESEYENRNHHSGSPQTPPDSFQLKLVQQQRRNQYHD